MVEDGSEGILGQDILFRSRLEAELRKNLLNDDKRTISSKQLTQSVLQNFPGSADASPNLSVKSNMSTDDENDMKHSKDMITKSDIPIILICIHGGLDSLLIVREALKRRVPILILTVN